MRKISVAVFLVAGLVLGLSVLIPGFAGAGPSKVPLPHAIPKQLTVEGATALQGTLAVTGASTLSSTLAVTGASTLTGGATLGAALDASDEEITNMGYVSWSAVATQVLENSFVIPTALSFYPVSSAGEVTSSIPTAISDGQDTWQTLTLINVGSQNVILKDAANTDLGGADITLGGTDAVTLIWNGSDWIRLYNTDN